MADKAALGTWSAGFCDCCSDCHTCCLTLWCPCVSFGRIAEILDRGGTPCCLHGALYCLLGGFAHFVSLYACVYRTKLRKLYRIEGSKATDCLVSCFCPHISICQEYRELKNRGFDMTAGWHGNVQMHTAGVTSAPAVEGGMSR